jgi:hypothetical protein
VKRTQALAGEEWSVFRDKTDRISLKATFPDRSPEERISSVLGVLRIFYDYFRRKPENE